MPARAIDVSHYQGHIDWDAVKASGVTYAFCKATEGSGGVDTTYRFNRARAKSTGLIVGAYHFAHPGTANPNEPEIEADHFLAVAQLADDEWAWLDYEQSPYSTDWALRWLTRVEKARPHSTLTGIYASDSRLGSLAVPWRFPRWDAAYRSTPPSSPWLFWQHTDKARVPGVPGLCDESYARDDAPKVIASTASKENDVVVSIWSTPGDKQLWAAFRPNFQSYPFFRVAVSDEQAATYELQHGANREEQPPDFRGVPVLEGAHLKAA